MNRIRLCLRNINLHASGPAEDKGCMIGKAICSVRDAKNDKKCHSSAIWWVCHCLKRYVFIFHKNMCSGKLFTDGAVAHFLTCL